MNTATLFDLAGEARALANQIESIAADLFSDDADQTEIYAKLEQLITEEANNRKDLEAKADAWCWVISSTRARSEARKAKARQLQILAKIDEKVADRLLDKLVATLAKLHPNLTKFKFPGNELISRKTTAVEIDPHFEPEDFDEIYQRTVTTVEFDKLLIAQRLKAGETIEGARLVERRSWRIA